MSEIETTDKDNIYSNNFIKYSNCQSETSKRKNVNNEAKNKRKKLKINSVSELEFLYNDSQKGIMTKTKNMKIQKKNLINYSSNCKNSTDILSPKIDIEYKHSRQYQQIKSKKSSSFDIFWESVKQYKKSNVDIMLKIKKHYSTRFGDITQHIHKSTMFHVEHIPIWGNISTFYCQSC
jgi:hypothetical protein